MLKILLLFSFPDLPEYLGRLTQHTTAGNNKNAWHKTGWFSWPGAPLKSKGSQQPTWKPDTHKLIIEKATPKWDEAPHLKSHLCSGDDGDGGDTTRSEKKNLSMQASNMSESEQQQLPRWHHRKHIFEAIHGRQTFSRLFDGTRHQREDHCCEPPPAVAVAVAVAQHVRGENV